VATIPWSAKRRRRWNGKFFMIAGAFAKQDTPPILMRLRVLFLASFVLTSVSRADSYRPLDHLWQGTKDLARPESLILLGAGTALTFVAMTQDDAVKDYFDGKDRLGGFEKVGNFWGGGVPSFGLALGFIGYGLAADKDPFLQAGEAHLEGILVSSAVVFGMKYSIRRPRPNNGPKESFPSGHSSLAFTTAGNMWGMYGPAAGIPAVALGVVTAVSRMAVSMHYLSDTVMGATLGFAIGYAFTHHHHDVKPAKVTVLPYFENRESFGLLVKAGF